MLDNVKFFLKDKAGFEQSVCKNANFDLKSTVSIITGEVMDYPKIGKYHNLEARITQQQAYMKGSLHKFMNVCLNEGEQNYNDFDWRDIHLVIEEISTTLQINPNDTIVTNLEFGFNIEIDDDPQKIIDYKLLMFNFKNHSKDLKFKGKGDYREYEMSDYSIKIYNKSKQYGQDRHILRVEIKFTMKRKLEVLGIYSLADLTNVVVLQNLFDFFIKQFDKLVIVDSFYDRSNIGEKDKGRLGLFTNPNYWMDALKSKQSHIRERLIREYRRLIRKYKLDSTQKMLRDKICDKFLELMRVPALTINEPILEM